MNMNKFELFLAKISDDTTSGAEQLTPKALDLIRAAIEDEEISDEKLAELMGKLVETFRNKLKEITPLIKLADRIENLPKENLRMEIDQLEKDTRQTFEHEFDSVGRHGAHLIRENSTVATISQSGTVLNVLVTAKKSSRDFHVIVPFGRPAGEGQLTARTLAENGIDVTLVPDSAIGLVARRSDIALVGADAITREFFLNKIGTLSLAIAARYFGIPFYICARQEKLTTSNKIPEDTRVFENNFFEPSESEFITTGVPLFERIPLSLVTGVITEAGIIAPVKGIIEISEDDK